MQVKAWVEEISIPTYKTGAPDKNPMFLEKRVYQGSSGAVYPFAVIDKVYDIKEDKIYKAVFIENQYLKIMVLPELGGRIQMAYDKTNDYHFIYYNRVIKPALVGLTGPWISGGIEFNWPQHHRPGTYEPVDYCIEENEDGSQTVWVSEIEKMFHTKGMAGFTLYPGRAYLEIKGKLYNRTALPQTFLWWANPAVAVHDHYQSVFPPDVHAVFDHGKRDVSSFPIATGTYYKVDYAPGTDISWYKNIPVPTSYMAANSAYDFMGGYDHEKQAGIVHIADHHVSPGKKQWTWGCGEFGKAWDRQLTDEDGPYCELMTGMFTDNQPDFSWISPNEERNFLQYFLPYKNVGYIKNASIDALINMENTETAATVQVYATAERKKARIQISLSGNIIHEDVTDLSPVDTYKRDITLPSGYDKEQLQVNVFDTSGTILVNYTPVTKSEIDIPEPAAAIPESQLIASTEELYLAGMHLEQYRHATFSPVAYYEEALRRSPNDIRNNNAMGLWHLRRGRFEKSEAYFRTAIKTQIKYNPNSYDGEVFYNLGLALFYQEKYEASYDFFYKASWNAAWQDKCFLFLARIDTHRGNYTNALQHTEQSVIKNYHGIQARHLKAALLRKLGRWNEAEKFARESLSIDAFDFGSGYELLLILQATKRIGEVIARQRQLTDRMRNDAHTYIEISLDYARAGLYEDAISLLGMNTAIPGDTFASYYLAYYHFKNNNTELAKSIAITAFANPVAHHFLNRLEDIQALKTIIDLNRKDYKAWYHLGNLWYDKRQYEDAIHAWEQSRNIYDQFPTVHRNLGLAYFNYAGNSAGALASYEKAWALSQDDARILFELDQLHKRLNYSPHERLKFLSSFPQQVHERDDLYIEYVALLNTTGRNEEALQCVTSRNFHPWEGGEGKTSLQYTISNIELAKIALETESNQEAIKSLEAAITYPLNLGEGKLFGAQENDIYYWLGCAYEKSGDISKANDCWTQASEGNETPSPAIFYNDQQPDKIFYQGLALLKLNKKKEADKRFNNLLHYANDHMHDEVKIDYFAVSLPDLMIFNDDLNKRNRILCEYLLALGKMGTGHLEKANEYFDSVLKMDANHMGAAIHAKLLQSFEQQTLHNNYSSL